MTLQKITATNFDPNGAGDTSGGIFGLAIPPEQCNIHLIPVPWEPTTSYLKGTCRGPQAILKASPQLDLFDAEFGEAFGVWRPWEYGIFCEDEDQQIHSWNREASDAADQVIAVGGAVNTPALKQALALTNSLSQKLNAWVYKTTQKKIAQNKIVGLVGGDHSVPFGAIRACAEHYKSIGILHLDAHADLRFEYEGFTDSHASIMNKVVREIPGVEKLVQVGIRDFCDMEYEQTQSQAKIKTHFQFQINAALNSGTTWDVYCKQICADLPQNVYLSFDIDGLDPALCPHTGTPVPGGLSFSQACHLFKTLVQSGRKVIGFDLVEVAPNPTRPEDEWDGNVGARMLYKLCATAIASQTWHS